MLIRGYVPRDVEETIRVYRNALGLEEQPDPEAEESMDEIDVDAWNDSLRENFAVVAIVDGMIVAFGDIDRSGRLNRLYVMSGYQSRTIGSQIVEILMGFFPSLVVMVESPAETREFFEKLGFVAIKEQRREVEDGIITSYLMSSPVPDTHKQESIAGRNYWIRADVV